MRKRPTVLLSGIGLTLALVAGTYAVLLRPPKLPEAPLALVPEEASAMAVIRVEGVVSSPLWSPLVVARGGTRGIDRLARRCGVNLLAELREVVLFTEGTDPRAWEKVGLVGRGPLERDALVACIRKVVSEGGGTVRSTEVEGLPAIAGGKGDSRALFLGADGVVVGSEETVRSVVRAVHGGPTWFDHDARRQLFEDVAQGRDLGVVGTPPPSFRAAFGRATDVPVEAITAVALGVDLGGPIRAGLALETRDAPGAKRVGEALRGALERAKREPLVAWSVAGTALRRVRMQTTANRVVITLELSPRQVTELVELAEEWLRDDDSASGGSGGDSPMTGSKPSGAGEASRPSQEG